MVGRALWGPAQQVEMLEGSGASISQCTVLHRLHATVTSNFPGTGDSQARHQPAQWGWGGVWICRREITPLLRQNVIVVVTFLALACLTVAKQLHC